MTYEYTLHKNGIRIKKYKNQYKQNIIAEIVKDLDKINNNTPELVFRVQHIRR